ncbi:hypothetical protein QK289_15680 [Exiguobacterium antarcticum]|uniref:Uncharacterized protein n=1 Tax=Exiguobacterium antarcticum TaxID=132920 RepID=A0ABT6R851_9BACL|nr:hypothetical protein [Exiguobacterium antarcticum]MDI3236456.1 hypothetical protein [Exiguobacterium antarcticum]
MTTTNLMIASGLHDDFNHRLLNIRNDIEKLQKDYGLHLEHLTMNLSDPNEYFLYHELQMIMYHLNDSYEDINYLNRPIIAEGTPNLSENHQMLLVDGHLVNLREPVEVKLLEENVWFKTWVMPLENDFGFTAFGSNSSPGQMQSASKIECVMRLRDCHQ